MQSLPAKVATSTRHVTLTLEMLQKRLAVFHLPENVWSLLTIGVLQTYVKSSYRSFVKTYHPDVQRQRFSLNEASAIIVAWMDGESVESIARRVHANPRTIQDVLYERTCAYHVDVAHRLRGDRHFEAVTFRYRWCMHLDKHAPMPLPRHEQMLQEARRLELGDVRDALVDSLPQRREHVDSTGYRIVTRVEGL